MNKSKALNKSQWSFILGNVYAIVLILFVKINNILSNGEYATGLGIFLMLVWIAGFVLIGIVLGGKE